MQELLEKSSNGDYSILLNLEKRFQALNFRNFFYKKLEIDYNLGKNDIYGLVAAFRISSQRFLSQLSSDSWENSQEYLVELQEILEKIKNSNIYKLLIVEFKTLSFIIQTEIGLKELEFKNTVLALYKSKRAFKEWIGFYKQQSRLHNLILKILDLQLQKFRFIFSTGQNNGYSHYSVLKDSGGWGEKLRDLVKNSSNTQLLVLGVTENGFYSRYTCMPSISAKTGLGLFPIIYSSLHDLKAEIILPNVISLLYSWEKLGCVSKKLRGSSYRNVKNGFLSLGHYIVFKDLKLEKVKEIFCLDSRILVVLMSGLKEYSPAVNEEILAQILAIWTF